MLNSILIIGLLCFHDKFAVAEQQQQQFIKLEREKTESFNSHFLFDDQFSSTTSLNLINYQTTLAFTSKEKSESLLNTILTKPITIKKKSNPYNKPVKRSKNKAINKSTIKMNSINKQTNKLTTLLTTSTTLKSVTSSTTAATSAATNHTKKVNNHNNQNKKVTNDEIILSFKSFLGKLMKWASDDTI